MRWFGQKKRKEAGEPKEPTKVVVPPVSPVTSTPPAEVKKKKKMTPEQRWQEIGIDYRDILRIEDFLGYKMAPQHFQVAAFDLEKFFREEGYEIKITSNEMLGVLCDMEVVNKRRAQLSQWLYNAAQIAVVREADRRIRSRLNMPKHHPIKAEMLDNEIKLINSEAVARKKPKI